MKILTLSKVSKDLRKIRNNEKIVFMSGVFDLFHFGHFKALEKAGSMGKLIVQIDGDILVKKRKGPTRPYLPASQRAKIVSSLNFVYCVFISNLPSENLRIIRTINPDLFIRSIPSNQSKIDKKNKEKEILSKLPKGKVVWLPQTPDISTTKIIPAVSKKNKKPTITIGISAYNEEKNILNLIKSIKTQILSGFDLLEVIIISDASTDNTVKIINDIKYRKIRLFENKLRLGKAKNLNKIFRTMQGDYLIILDADIKLSSKKTLRYIIKEFLRNKKVGLVGGNAQPILSNNFISKAINSSVLAYNNIQNAIDNGNNIFGVKGCILGIRRELIENYQIPNNISIEDSFLYFFALVNGWEFRYAKLAKATYILPSSFKDHILQNKRFINYSQIKYIFGDLVEKQYFIPFKLRLKYFLKEFLRLPGHSLFIFLANSYCKFLLIFSKNDIKFWPTASTTKKII